MNACSLADCPQKVRNNAVYHLLGRRATHAPAPGRKPPLPPDGLSRILWPMKLASSTTLAALGVSAAACAPSALEGGFDSPNPAARLYAIAQAAREEDRSPATLRHIVEQLDSDDPAVRLVAITTLARLTGETLGYGHDDPAPARRAAIRRWTEHLADGAPHG